MAQLSYVKTGQDFGKQLSGLGGLIKQSRDEKKKIQGVKDFESAWQSGDMNALNKVAINNPELAPRIKKMSDMQRFMRTDNQTSLWKGAQEAINASVSSDGTLDRDSLTNYLTNRIDSGATTKGGDMNNSISLMNMVLDTNVSDEQLVGNLQKTINLAERLVPDLRSGSSGGNNVQSKFVTDKGTIGLVMRDGSVKDTGQKVSDSYSMTEEGNIFGRQSGKLTDISGNVIADKGSYQDSLKEYRTQKSTAEVEEADRLARQDASFQAAEAIVPMIGKAENFVRMYNDGIRALKSGARSGTFQDFMPTLNDATKELNHIKGELGLGIIAGGKFGALSESELKFALEIAVPPKDPKELEAWMVRKRDLQMRLLGEYRKLGDLYSAGYTKYEALSEMGSLPMDQSRGKPYTNDEVDFLAKKYNKSPKRVREELWKKAGGRK